MRNGPMLIAAGISHFPCDWPRWQRSNWSCSNSCFFSISCRCCCCFFCWVKVVKWTSLSGQYRGDGHGPMYVFIYIFFFASRSWLRVHLPGTLCALKCLPSPNKSCQRRNESQKIRWGTKMMTTGEMAELPSMWRYNNSKVNNNNNSHNGNNEHAMSPTMSPV